MAIKGKSKPKARRAVTRGPRPVYVPAKRPLPQRRGFQIGLLVAVALISIAAIAYGVARDRSDRRERELGQRLRATMTTYSSIVDPALAAVGQPLPPSSIDVLPDLSADVEALGAGELSAKQAEERAGGYAERAEGAAEALSKIEVAKIAGGKGFDAAFVRDLFNATNKMQSGLRLYAEAAKLLLDAASADADLQKDLLDRASSMIAIAGDAFRSGYGDYVNAQFTAGTFQSTVPGVP